MQQTRPFERVHRDAPMSRGLRTARGTAGATAAVLLAAASHALVGGAVTATAIIATIVIALPLCVALAGRIASLWRLSLAVVFAQFLFHWSFVGLGSGAALSGSAGGGSAAAHTSHLAALVGIGSTAAEVGASASAATAAGAAMWLSHAVAAVLTIALLYRGERAALALLQLVCEVLPAHLPAPVEIESRPAIRHTHRGFRAPAQLHLRTSITHRGPPLVSFSH